MNLKENDEKLRDIALFRYGLISPIINDINNYSSKVKYYNDIASKSYTLFGKDITLSPNTIKKWFLSYSKYGINGLYPKIRSDNGTSRKLSIEVINKIKDYYDSFPYISGTIIYNKLIEDGFINKSEISLSTVLKTIRDKDLKNRSTSVSEKRAFEMEHSNDCWQSDTSYGPYLTINGIKRRTYLIITIDDASRLITGYKFFFEDNSVNLQEVLKDAVKKYGVPKRLFVDNGTTYKNEQLSLICAYLGIVLIHAKPYSPTSKAKVERMFGTIKHSWLNGININSINSIEDLNKILSDFIIDYNNKIHSGIKDSPNNRWFKDYSNIKKLDNEVIDESFLHTTYSTIRSDCLARIKNREYEVPIKYIKQKICIRYNHLDMSKIYIYENGKNVSTAYIVKKIDNSKIKRKNNIYE
jgi:transposase InsO family protein